MERVETHSEEETVAQGVAIGKRLRPGDVVALYGELGSGKTHLIQGMCSALGVREHVASPTFTIVNEYNVEGRCIYHFDFYRVDSAREIFDLGVEEYFNSGGISLIEWAEKARQFLPPHRYEIRLELGDDRNSRSITVDEILEARS